jgi:hypothetical protein
MPVDPAVWIYYSLAMPKPIFAHPCIAHYERAREKQIPGLSVTLGGMLWVS